MDISFKFELQVKKLQPSVLWIDWMYVGQI